MRWWTKPAPSAELRQEIARLLGQRPHAAGVRAFGAIKADPLVAADPPLETPLLTLRELEMLALLAQGCRTRAIAQTLGVAETTVATHRRALRSKLGASGSELVRLAVLQNHGR